MTLMTRLNLDSLLSEARRQTGLDDFGDPEFIEPFTQFLQSANNDAHLTPAGRQILIQETTQYLTNRLHLEQHFSAYPEIAEEALDRPIFVTGLYRSGTTKLYRLLCHDPRWRYIETWQTMFPAPLGLEDTSIKGRVDLTNEVLQRMADIAPGTLEAHHMRADQPEEDYLLMVQSLRTARVVLNTPSHVRWCERQSAEPMYRYLKRCLQLLKWQLDREGLPAGRLILKAPAHLEYLTSLHRVFPDAKVLVTHRDPAKSVASNCLMLEHMHYMYSDPVDLSRLGEEKLHTAALALERSLEARSLLGPEIIKDVLFEAIAKHPLDLMPEIYAFLGESFDAAVLGKIREGEARLQDQKSGTGHRPELSRYGLNKDQVYAKTSDYLRWAESTLGLKLA